MVWLWPRLAYQAGMYFGLHIYHFIFIDWFSLIFSTLGLRYSDKQAARWQVRNWNCALFYFCYLYIITLGYILKKLDGTFRTLNWILQPVVIIINSATKNGLWFILTWINLFNWNNWFIAENCQSIFWDQSNNFNFYLDSFGTTLLKVNNTSLK
jgi:hypothetical protein